jgi:hypothetical protein
MGLNRDCSRFAATLWKYGTSEASEVEQRWMQAHIDRCRACKEQADAIIITSRELAALRNSAVPASDTNFQDLLIRLAVQRQKTSNRSVHLRRLCFAGTALLGVLLCGALVRYGLLGPVRMASETSGRTPSNPYGAEAGQDTRAPLAHWHALNLSPMSSQLKLPGEVDAFVSAQQTVNPGHKGYGRAKPSLEHREIVRSHRLAHGLLAHGLKAKARRLYTESMTASKAVVSGQPTEAPEESDAQAATQPCAYVMPAVGPAEDGGVRRTYVMDGIPMTTAAGRAGSAATEAENPAKGRAL